MLTVHRYDLLPPLSSALGQLIPMRFEALPEVGVWMSELEVRALIVFAGRVNLRGLDLSHPSCKQPPLPQLLPMLEQPRFRALQQVALGRPDHPSVAANLVVDPSLLLSLSLMPQLRSLYLATAKLSDPTLWMLLPTFPALQEFRLGERASFDLVGLMAALGQCVHLTSVGFCGPSSFIGEMYRLSISPIAAHIRALSLEGLDNTGESDPFSDPQPSYYPEAFLAMSSLTVLTLRNCIDPGDLLQLVHRSSSLRHIIIEPQYLWDDLESSLAKIDWIMRLLPDVMFRAMQLRVTLKIAPVGRSRWTVSKAYSQGVRKRIAECWMMGTEVTDRFRLEQA